MSIAALFTVGKTWKQAKCPSMDDWMRKMGCMCTMEYHYPAIRKAETLPLPTTWMRLENVILSDVSQTEKVKNHMFSLICGI